MCISGDKRDFITNITPINAVVKGITSGLAIEGKGKVKYMWVFYQFIVCVIEISSDRKEKHTKSGMMKNQRKIREKINSSDVYAASCVRVVFIVARSTA